MNFFLSSNTKSDEKGESKGGRKFPLTNAINSLLEELKAVQECKWIHSEFVFCHENGEWIKTDAYITCLRRMLKSLGFEITNNHAFRMSLNSNILFNVETEVSPRSHQNLIDFDKRKKPESAKFKAFI